MDARRSRKGKSSKAIVKKMQEYISAGDLFEGEQLMKTLHARLSANGEWEKGFKILNIGCLTLLKAGHANAGHDIGLLLLDICKQAKWKATLDRIEPLNTIFLNFPDGEEADKVKKNFMRKSIDW